MEEDSMLPPCGRIQDVELASSWVLDHLLRLPIDLPTIHTLLSMLPLRHDQTLFKKPLLLRLIQSEVSNGKVSERILDLLELISEVDSSEKKKTPESIKMAYCRVAVDCTVRFLVQRLEENGEYMEAMERIWRARVGKLEKEDSRLICKDLVRWKRDLEDAIGDVEMRDMVLSGNTRNEALIAVEDYVSEAWDDLGPSFLERLAENLEAGPRYD